MKIKQFVPLAIGALIIGAVFQLTRLLASCIKDYEYTLKDFLIGTVVYGILFFFVELFAQWYTKRYNKKKAEKNNNKSNRATNV